MTKSFEVAILKYLAVTIAIFFHNFSFSIAVPHQAFNLVAEPAHLQEYVLRPTFKISAMPVTRVYTFTVTETTASLDGFLRPVLAINNQIPGPLIEANEGDCLEIRVINYMAIGLTIHWHGLYQNGTNWEDGVTGVTQCPIPPNGGEYTYRFNLTGQFGTFWYHSHHQNLMADGINGPLIIHSVSDPLKRYVDFDQDVVLMLADWYHNTSTSIIADMLSEAGYFGTPAAPSPHSAIINGVGQWNCSFATATQQCQQVTSPPRFTFKAGERIRFRLINAGVHAMFFYSVDEHTLNVTEADGTGIYGPSALHRLRFHNGQRYSVIIQTSKADVGKSFYMRARMDSDCWAWVFNDVQLTALGIMTLTGDNPHTLGVKASKATPQTLDWPEDIPSVCLDIDSDSMTPIIRKNVPTEVSGSGAFHNAFGFEEITSGAYITRIEAEKLASNGSTPAANVTPDGISLNALPPPTPIGTVGKFFVNNKTWRTFSYQPVLHDLLPPHPQGPNSARVANIVYPHADWYDLYLVNLDVISHPYHLHGMDMHIVASGSGLPTAETLASVTYRTKNPLRRDTIVIGAASFSVVRLHADIPGAWIMHCHIGWHIAGGFAGVVVVQPKAIEKFRVPQVNLDLCQARVGPLDTIEPGASKKKI
ncbi:hypothetical protein O181_026113 [Austropuccinia psidii MF-1]|uniref:Laccase n=1 Tax=Austropuccinia psidii MF-1 TaxID=1389203 RepID=A0A9Q3GZQ6_9BASI|nr:hypothetical protein [Austropuccinia psidii MF-1]